MLSRPVDLVVCGAMVSALAIWLRFALVLIGVLRTPKLSQIAPVPAPSDGASGTEATMPWPRLSAIVACRDEAATVERAMSSLLTQDYPNLEVIAVNDRSRDSTGAILDRLSREYAALRVVHVDSLPSGWLGKTHAMHQGAAHASGDWLLFTDADVLFAPGVLRRAVAWAAREQMGHAVVLPTLIAPGLWERALVSLFGLLFHFRAPVRDLRRPGTAAYIGIGAFNLVRKEAYAAVGGHERLRLEVVDDMKLGMVLRRSGVRQGCADAAGLLRVRWQHGFGPTLTGLMKNFFAACEYRWLYALGAAAFLLFVTTAPLVAALPSTPWPARLLAVLTAVLAVVVHGVMARRAACGKGYEGVALPIVGPCLAAVAVLSAVVTTLRRGIVWRGTLYPLDQLVAACVRERAWPRDRAPGHLPPHSSCPGTSSGDRRSQ